MKSGLHYVDLSDIIDKNQQLKNKSKLSIYISKTKVTVAKARVSPAFKMSR